MQPQDDVPSFETPTSFTFLPTQLQILQDALNDVKKLDSKKERNQMIKTIRNRILELPESNALDAHGREDLRAAIGTWFSLRSKRQTNKIKFGKTWNARLVLYEENKEEVLAMQAKLFKKAEKRGENPKRNFDFLQRAISKVWKRKSKEDRKALQKLSRKWNKEGAPREQKQNAANKYTWKYTKKFAEDMYKSLGVRFLFLVALETPSGVVNTGIMDFNDSLGGGATYTAKHENWKTEGVDMDSWNNHNRDYYNAEQSAPISTTKVPRSLMHLDLNEYEEPILPDPLLVPRRETGRRWRQSLVRAFMTHHYSLASGSQGAIPWKKLIPRLRECVEEEHLPSNLLSLIGEPSTMKDDHCLSLLAFWFRRQTNGMLPSFRFKRYMIKDELVEALPRKQVDIPQTDIPPIASGSSLPPTAIPPNASRSSPDAEARGTGKHSNKRGKAKRPGRSGKVDKGKGKARETSRDSVESTAHSKSNSDPESAFKANTRGTGEGTSKTRNEGQGKANSSSDEYSSTFSSSDSDSESTTTTITSTSDSSSDRDSEENRSLSRSPNPANQSHAHVDPVRPPDNLSGDENMSPSPIPDLSPELRSIERMVQQGIPRDEVLRALSTLTIRSHSQSPVKAPSRALSPRTDLRKRRGRPSTEGLPPASPTKKSRLQPVDNAVEASPSSPTTSLPSSHHLPPLVLEPASDQPSIPSIESTEIIPEASSSRGRPSRDRGARIQTSSRAGGLRGKGSRKNTEVPSQRVTRSNAPKKRTTRANPK